MFVIDVCQILKTFRLFRFMRWNQNSKTWHSTSVPLQTSIVNTGLNHASIYHVDEDGRSSSSTPLNLNDCPKVSHRGSMYATSQIICWSLIDSIGYQLQSLLCSTSSPHFLLLSSVFNFLLLWNEIFWLQRKKKWTALKTKQKQKRSHRCLEKKTCVIVSSQKKCVCDRHVWCHLDAPIPALFSYLKFSWFSSRFYRRELY